MKESGGITLRQSLNILWKAFRVSFRVKGFFSLAVGILGFAAAFLPTVTSLWLGRFTNEMQALAQGTEEDPGRAALLFGVLSGLFLLGILFRFLQGYTTARDSIRTNAHMKEHIMQIACRVQYRCVENYGHFKEKAEFADTMAGFRASSSMQMILTVLQDIVSLIVILVVLWSVNSWIVVIVLVATLPAAILSFRQQSELYYEMLHGMPERILSFHSFLILAGQHDWGVNEVRHFRLFDYLKARWKGFFHSYTHKKQQLSRQHVKANCIADILRGAVYIGALLLAAWEIYENPLLGLGVFTLTFAMTGQLQTVAGRILFGVAQMYGDLHYMRDFFALDEFEQENIKEEAPLTGDISFSQVEFSYPGAREPAITQMTVTIREGETIALVGENGSGKSTFVNLLCGMYAPDDGVICIGGKNVQAHLGSVRSSISAVFQDFGRYETTVRQNLQLSNKGRTASDEELLHICQVVGLREDIAELQDGLDEKLGVFSELSKTLSGGQWQKVAIARALYHDSANIMILDEPTSALDPVAEARIYENFSDVTRGKTTILVSHRLGITKLVDRILVFSQGQMVEEGSHETLLRKNGVYAQMYHAQAQWYDTGS